MTIFSTAAMLFIATLTRAEKVIMFLGGSDPGEILNGSAQNRF